MISFAACTCSLIIASSSTTIASTTPPTINLAMTAGNFVRGGRESSHISTRSTSGSVPGFKSPSNLTRTERILSFGLAIKPPITNYHLSHFVFVLFVSFVVKESLLHHRELPQPSRNRQQRIIWHESLMTELQRQCLLQQQGSTTHHEHLRKTTMALPPPLLDLTVHLTCPDRKSLLHFAIQTTCTQLRVQLTEREQPFPVDQLQESPYTHRIPRSETLHCPSLLHHQEFHRVEANRYHAHLVQQSGSTPADHLSIVIQDIIEQGSNGL